MKRVAHIDGVAYGIVVEEKNIFVKWKWKEVNVGECPSRICAQEFTTEHEITPEFWNSFREVSSADWNELWVKDSSSVKYQERNKKCK